MFDIIFFICSLIFSLSMFTYVYFDTFNIVEAIKIIIKKEKELKELKENKLKIDFWNKDGAEKRIRINVEDFNYNVFIDLINNELFKNKKSIYVNVEIIYYKINLESFKVEEWASAHNCPLNENEDDCYDRIQQYLNAYKINNKLDNF